MQRPRTRSRSFSPRSRSAFLRPALISAIGKFGRDKPRVHRAVSSSERDCDFHTPSLPPGDQKKDVVVRVDEVEQSARPAANEAAVMKGVSPDMSPRVRSEARDIPWDRARNAS